jgi:DNA-binding MarR family transcriptional regulator
MRDDVDAIIEQWQAVRPELDASPIGVVGRLSRLARELETRLEPVYREHGLEPGWHDVLATLRRSGQLRVTDLTTAMMIGSSGTTKRLDRLEQAGLVERSPDPNDRRGTLIDLTAKGRALIDELTPAHLDNERALIASLTPDEQATLIELLRKLRLGLSP